MDLRLPSPNHLWQAFGWVAAVILLVFAPIAVQRYRRTATWIGLTLVPQTHHLFARANWSVTTA